MKKTILLLFSLILSFSNTFAQITESFDFNDEGQKVCLAQVTVDQSPPSATLHFLDAELNSTDQTSVYRRPLYGSGADWVLQVSDLAPGTASWTDTEVQLGERWEYQIRRSHANGSAFGYVGAAIYHDQCDYRGQMILVVADDLPNALPEELLRLKKDLTGDGWYVNELIVGKGAADFDDGESVVTIKNSITEIYNNAPSDDKPKVLFILGHVPLPRSGQGLQPPDGHIEASGARGSDSYYADIDGLFTDTATYDDPQQNHPLLKNYPGDFKWDQDTIPSTLEMAFGRVNFRYISSGDDQEEIAAMKRYLDRLHDFRQVKNEDKLGQYTAFNANGYHNSTEASYRCLPALSNGTRIFANRLDAEDGHNQWVKDNGPFMWYMQNRFVPQLDEWDSVGMDALVYSSDQSYWGYGDLPNPGGISNWHASTIRRILSYESRTLVALWTTSAVNVFHQAGLGEPLGYACKAIMDHNTSNQNLQKVEQDWDNSDWWNRTHFNFFGDPTLRLYQTRPVLQSSLYSVTNAFDIALVWSPPENEVVSGYAVYKSRDEFGPYRKVPGDSLFTTPYFPDPDYQVGDWYMIRAVSAVTTGSGTFLNPSQGIFIQVNETVKTKELTSNLDYAIAPNPTSDQLNIQSEWPFTSIQVWDNKGVLVLQQKQAMEQQAQLDIHHLPSGEYHLKITGREQSGSKTFVKF